MDVAVSPDLLCSSCGLANERRAGRRICKKCESLAAMANARAKPPRLFSNEQRSAINVNQRRRYHEDPAKGIASTLKWQKDNALQMAETAQRQVLLNKESSVLRKIDHARIVDVAFRRSVWISIISETRLIRSRG